MIRFGKLRLSRIDNKFIVQGRYFFAWITLPRFDLYKEHPDSHNMIERYPQTYNTYEEAAQELTKYKIQLGIGKPEVLYETTKDD